MELVVRTAAIALTAALAASLVKKANPEISLLLGLAASTVILLAAAGLLQGIKELYQILRERYALPELYLLPMIKCMAIAVLVKYTAELCRDASQGAAASAVELVGAAAALGLILPQIREMLTKIGELI